MSESTARLKPADFRRQAYLLIRQCWKLLLIAILLMSVIGWAGQGLEHYGEGIAQKAYDAHMEAFYAENPRPEDEKEAIMWAYFDEWLAQHDAEKLYDRAFLPWKIGGYAIDVLDALVSGMLLVGLYAGLLMQRRSGECSLHSLRIGFSRWKTAAWLAIRVTLNCMGWGLLAMIPCLMLSNALGGIGDILAIVILLWVALWAECHYALAFVHMAEDTENRRTVTDYITAAVDDMNFFTVRGLLRTAWPAYALMGADFVLGVAGALLPVLAIPAVVFTLVSGILCPMLLHACYTCVYAELRAHIQAQTTPGEARALASGEESTEE